MTEIVPELIDGMRQPVFLGGFIHADDVQTRVDLARWPLTFRPYYRVPPPEGVDPWTWMELEFQP
jgi:hypothetical protein